MSHREDLIDFTRGAMDRLRELACVPSDLQCGVTKTADGWELVAPGKHFEFRVEPRSAIYSTLMFRVTAKQWNPIALVRTRSIDVDVENAIERFIRGT